MGIHELVDMQKQADAFYERLREELLGIKIERWEYFDEFKMSNLSSAARQAADLGKKMFFRRAERLVTVFDPVEEDCDDYLELPSVDVTVSRTDDQCNYVEVTPRNFKLISGVTPKMSRSRSKYVLSVRSVNDVLAVTQGDTSNHLYHRVDTPNDTAVTELFTELKRRMTLQ